MTQSSSNCNAASSVSYPEILGFCLILLGLLTFLISNDHPNKSISPIEKEPVATKGSADSLDASASPSDLPSTDPSDTTSATGNITNTTRATDSTETDESKAKAKANNDFAPDIDIKSLASASAAKGRQSSRKPSRGRR